MLFQNSLSSLWTKSYVRSSGRRQQTSVLSWQHGAIKFNMRTKLFRPSWNMHGQFTGCQWCLGLASIAWQSDRWSCRNQKLIAIKAATQCSIVRQATLVGHRAGNSQCGWMASPSPGADERSCDSAVRYLITDARPPACPPFPRSLTWLYSLLYL